MKLVNVRLDPDDARMAEELRHSGVQLSRLVREAIRARYAQRPRRRGRGRRPSAIMTEIYSQLPDPPGLARSSRDLRDRRSVRRAILARMHRAAP